ncbi:membrane protein insertase YidC [Flavobacterium agricola]|uniref:Membrane protein insertase YidC n=1 Tax=Flavobacterium agricola TaxID=2870839 RepID=A0ABY6M3X7_9FLAO|nr:membrane protein insertase YidC [Flavobacterium agricola]UYW02514.1 membrane protein insertase YidC [Flavobacterium agricola]
MEEKKFDIKSIIGLLLISGVMIWMMYNNVNKESEKMAQEVEQKQIEAKAAEAQQLSENIVAAASDSTKLNALQATLGAFSYSATLPSATDAVTEVSNGVLTLKFANKGGYLKEVILNNEENFQTKEPITLVKDGNSFLNMEVKTLDNRILNTQDLFFEPTLTKEGDNQVLSMRLKASENSYLEYRYVLRPDNYMMDFGIRTQGLQSVVNTTSPLDLQWQLKAFRNEQSVSYENRYTEVFYEYDGKKTDYLGQGSVAETKENDVTYIAYKQHFFTSILLTDTPFNNVELKSENIVKDEKIDTTFTKNFYSSIPLDFKNGEVNYAMNLYFGPSDYELLKSYDKNLQKSISLGWGIFGWINKFLFIPIFGVLIKFIPHGIAIIVFTIIVRLVMSPITYKSYVSQAKMKVLRPEINELNEKYAKDPMKKQQETMKLYSSAGVNPMAGCLPALAQIPVFYALFQFFPAAFDLRGKSFLWAHDLATYDAVIKLPFYIPFYGNHVSLFPILASVAIFFYMKMTTGDQAMSTPPQEGMPDMGKIMKIMIYVSPVMMLFFFNNYASGLSLYYFVSNLITIGIMWVIKNRIVNEDKIHAQIQENKKSEKPKSKFQQRMQQMLEQAEEQKKAKNNK